MRVEGNVSVIIHLYSPLAICIDLLPYSSNVLLQPGTNLVGACDRLINIG